MLRSGSCTLLVGLNVYQVQQDSNVTVVLESLGFKAITLSCNIKHSTITMCIAKFAYGWFAHFATRGKLVLRIQCTFATVGSWYECDYCVHCDDDASHATVVSGREGVSELLVRK